MLTITFAVFKKNLSMSFIQENVSLKPFNTFAIAAVARYFVEIFSEDELVQLLSLNIIKENNLLVLEAIFC
jgi:UDP-N-acetylmuramate dehydrogenase